MGIAPAQPARPVTDALASSGRAALRAGHYVLARYLRGSEGGGLGVSRTAADAPVVPIEIVGDGARGMGVQMTRRAAGSPGGLAATAPDPVRGASGRLAVPCARPGEAAADPDHGATLAAGDGVSEAVFRLGIGDVFVVPGAELGRPDVQDLRVSVLAGTIACDGVFFRAGVSW